VHQAKSVLVYCIFTAFKIVIIKYRDVLLWPQQKPNKEAVDYPRSGWFGHHSMDEGEQQKM